MAFLLLLQSLTAQERAVFILKETFDLGHSEIAGMLDIETTYSRQLLRRAKLKISDAEQPTVPDADVQQIVERFYTAMLEGDLAQMNELVAEDVVFYSDGGGQASAALIPLEGRDRVITVLTHLMNNQIEPLEASWRRLNGKPALVLRTGTGIHSTHTVTIRDGRIHRMYAMRNPDKLHYIQ